MSKSDSDKAEQFGRSAVDADNTKNSDVSSVEKTALLNEPVTDSPYDVGFMMHDQEELVDLDSLFDALNIAAEEGVDAIGYVGGTGGNSGVLTVTNEALAVAGVTGSMDDVNIVAGTTGNDPAAPDES